MPLQIWSPQKRRRRIAAPAWWRPDRWTASRSPDPLNMV